MSDQTRGWKGLKTWLSQASRVCGDCGYTFHQHLEASQEGGCLACGTSKPGQCDAFEDDDIRVNENKSTKSKEDVNDVLRGCGLKAPTSTSTDSDKSLFEIAEAIVSGDPERINETSLSRIAHHVARGEHKSFAMITSFRPSDKYGPKKDVKRDPEDNNADYKKFKNDLGSAHLPHTKMRGRWKNEDGSITSEPSAFVHGISKKAAVKLGYKHHQQAVAYNGPDTKGRTHMIWMDYENGNTTHHGNESFDDVGEFHPTQGRQYMSAVKGGKKNFSMYKSGGKKVEFSNHPSLDASGKITQKPLVMAKPKGTLPESLEEGAGDASEEYGWIEFEPEGVAQAYKFNIYKGLARDKAKKSS